jgi:hypothetical protein
MQGFGSGSESASIKSLIRIRIKSMWIRIPIAMDARFNSKTHFPTTFSRFMSFFSLRLALNLCQYVFFKTQILRWFRSC